MITRRELIYFAVLAHSHLTPLSFDLQRWYFDRILYHVNKYNRFCYKILLLYRPPTLRSAQAIFNFLTMVSLTIRPFVNISMPIASIVTIDWVMDIVFV
jgi:hypothetical protein